MSENFFHYLNQVKEKSGFGHTWKNEEVYGRFTEFAAGKIK